MLAERSAGTLPKRTVRCIFGAVEHGQRIVINPEVCGGRPIVAGTRIRVVDVLEMLAGGASEAEILADFPTLTKADIRASLAYAARVVGRKGVRAGWTDRAGALTDEERAWQGFGNTGDADLAW